MAGRPRSEIGAYRLLRLVSAGAEASVYEAQDTRLNRRVALKLRPLPADTAERAEQLAEAKALAKLSHPLIPQVYDVLELPDALALVLEFVHGRNLDSLLEATEVGPGMTVHMGLDLCSALAAAHAAGVVHGDLKAGNILVTRDGHLKLLDFGLAHRRQAAGSALSVSPEQLRGERPDSRADLFALGCLLYRLLDGAYPFALGGGDWQAQRLRLEPPLPGGETADWPAELSALVMALLSKQPADRPASALVVRQRLLGLSRELPAGDAAALARLASRVEEQQRARQLAGYGPSPTAGGHGQSLAGRVGLALAVATVAVTGGLFYAGLMNTPTRNVQIEAVYLSGNPGMSADRLQALLGQAVSSSADLQLVDEGGVIALSLHVNCASEVCSSQLVGRAGATETADTRAMLVGDSELAWQRRLRQGLAQLSQALDDTL